MRDGVSDGGNGWPARGFADPETGSVRDGVDQFDHHLGHLAEAQNRIALPVARADPAGVEPDPFLERPAGTMNDAALELVDGTIRIDHKTGIRRTPHADETHAL